MLAMHRDEQALFSHLQYRACPAAFAGKAFGSWARRSKDTSTPDIVGSVSGHLYQSLPRSVRSRFVVRRTCWGSPTTDLDLIHPAPCAERTACDVSRCAQSEHISPLAGRPQQGASSDRLAGHRRFDALDALDPAPRGRRPAAHVRSRSSGAPSIAAGADVCQRVAGDPARDDLDGRELRHRARKRPREAATRHHGDGARLSVERVPGHDCARTGDSRACRRSPSFPGVCRTERLGQRPAECLTLGQLAAGRRYYVLFTTAAGRTAFMNDLLDVTGFFHRTPLLRFVQKGRGVTSLTGELYEAQAIEAIQDAAARCRVRSSFFVLVADEGASAHRLYAQVDEGSPRWRCHEPHRRRAAGRAEHRVSRQAPAAGSDRSRCRG